MHTLVDMEFWRMPSRHAKIDEYEEIQKAVKHKKLSLKQHYVDLTAESDTENTGQLGRIEDAVKKVCDTF